jgi:hypothetical protein
MVFGRELQTLESTQALWGPGGLQVVSTGLDLGSPHVILNAEGLDFLLVLVDQPVEVVVALHVRGDPQLLRTLASARAATKCGELVRRRRRNQTRAQSAFSARSTQGVANMSIMNTRRSFPWLDIPCALVGQLGSWCIQWARMLSSSSIGI